VLESPRNERNEPGVLEGKERKSPVPRRLCFQDERAGCDSKRRQKNQKDEVKVGKEQVSCTQEAVLSTKEREEGMRGAHKSLVPERLWKSRRRHGSSGPRHLGPRDQPLIPREQPLSTRLSGRSLSLITKSSLSWISRKWFFRHS
jgi:hypothetical protein